MRKKMKKRAIIFFLLIASSNLFNLNPYQVEPREDEISLRIFPLSINFRAADPDQEPVIPADSPLIVEVSSTLTRDWKLTLIANGNLVGGAEASIPIQNVKWTATPSPPFLSGILSFSKPQLVASGHGKKEIIGELNFFLNNSWDYQAGDYSQTLSFTLTVL
jgi:hypothetical protein